jgi:hypothetical protein
VEGEIHSPGIPQIVDPKGPRVPARSGRRRNAYGHGVGVREKGRLGVSPEGEVRKMRPESTTLFESLRSRRKGGATPLTKSGGSQISVTAGGTSSLPARGCWRRACERAGTRSGLDFGPPRGGRGTRTGRDDDPDDQESETQTRDSPPDSCQIIALARTRRFEATEAHDGESCDEE